MINLQKFLKAAPPEQGRRATPADPYFVLQSKRAGAIVFSGRLVFNGTAGGNGQTTVRKADLHSALSPFYVDGKATRKAARLLEYLEDGTLTCVYDSDKPLEAEPEGKKVASQNAPTPETLDEAKKRIQAMTSESDLLAIWEQIKGSPGPVHDMVRARLAELAKK